jgi:hypothetical protein
LGNYAQCLGEKNRKNWLAEETHMRNELGLRTVSDAFIDELKAEVPHKKIIKTCHNYEIVSNPKYSA